MQPSSPPRCAQPKPMPAQAHAQAASKAVKQHRTRGSSSHGHAISKAAGSHCTKEPQIAHGSDEDGCQATAPGHADAACQQPSTLCAVCTATTNPRGRRRTHEHEQAASLRNTRGSSSQRPSDASAGGAATRQSATQERKPQPHTEEQLVSRIPCGSSETRSGQALAGVTHEQRMRHEEHGPRGAAQTTK